MSYSWVEQTKQHVIDTTIFNLTYPLMPYNILITTPPPPNIWLRKEPTSSGPSPCPVNYMYKTSQLYHSNLQMLFKCMKFIRYISSLSFIHIYLVRRHRSYTCIRIFGLLYSLNVCYFLTIFCVLTAVLWIQDRPV